MASWLSMRAEGTMVTKLNQFPHNFALSIAQSSYEVGGSRESLLDVYGLSMLTKHSAKRKWYMFKKTRVAEAVNAAAGWPGFFYLTSAYVPDAYPDLMEEVGLYAVGT